MDIQVAHFLGGEGRLFLPRQRSPSGDDPGRAFQRTAGEDPEEGIEPESDVSPGHADGVGEEQTGSLPLFDRRTPPKLP